VIVVDGFKVDLGPDGDVDDVGLCRLLKTVPKSLIHVAKLCQATSVDFSKQPGAINLVAFSIKREVN